MNIEHPIAPPPELVQQWFDDARNAWAEPQHHVATRAAQWGADQELEACCKTLDMVNGSNYWSQVLRSGRRPKPPSLKELALKVLESAPGPDYPSVMTILDADQHALIRRALEALDD